MKWLVSAIAFFTRRIYPPGMERVLRFIHDPDNRPWSVKSVVPCNGYRIYADTKSYIEWQVFFRGDYEPVTTKAIRKRLSKGSVSVDVGANIGVHALTMSEGGEVYAFEPEPSVFQKLKANVKLNGLNNVHAFDMALSDKEGVLTLYPGGSNEGQGSLYAGHSNVKKEGVPVDVGTLDGVLGGLDRLDIVKIDTEGNDMKVLYGGHGIIKKFRPVIIFEWHKESWALAGNSLRDIFDFFLPLDYTLTDMDKNEPLTLDASGFVNVIALPRL